MASTPAPMSPARSPSGVYWISRCRVDSASERWYTLWRTAARNSGPTRVMPPPMNTCDGLKKFTTEASICPTWAPERCTTWLAAMSPARLASATSCRRKGPRSAISRASRGLWPASAASVAMRAIAGPAAMASTQPRLPQWQRGPSGTTQMWPTSPAEPLAPR